MSKSADLAKKRISNLMSARGWTAHDLAAHSGVSNSLIYRWLTGSGSPSLDNLDRVADALGTTASALLDPDKAPEAPRVAPDILEALERCNETELAAVRAVLGGFQRGWDALAASRQESEQLAHHRKRKAK